MKSIATNISKTLIPGSVLTCADNSGAKMIMIINKVGKGGGGKKGKLAASGIGDIFTGSVKAGSPEYIKKKVQAVIIRQKQPIRRPNGMRVKFEDNACILVKEGGLPVGTEVKGPMAREVVEIYIKMAGVASRVV
ncbi:MAG: uL14 family ribosomal protein [Candidatus Marsarchaeota archaeon]|jgi:large subunit ribosomal protein L14|nr:uL14 family ribosomal protein [Candidatus Marsarchaeota archaeon]